MEDIPVPDIVPVRAPDGPDTAVDTRDASRSTPTPESDTASA
jgi:hypothetical protein